MLYKIQSPEFCNLYEASTPEELKVLDSILNDSNTSRLVAWIRYHKSRDVGELSIRELREKARINNIPNYSRLDKFSLVKAIRETNPR